MNNLNVAKRTQAKPNEFTLIQKVEVLAQIEKEIPYRTIAKDFRCSLGAISKIKQTKRQIEEAVLENEPPNKKRIENWLNFFYYDFL